MEWYDLRVQSVRKETKDATSVIFDVPANIKACFAGLAGQHISIRVTLGNEEMTRRYSLSSLFDGTLRITVKAVKDGKVSGFINQCLKAGDTLKVSPPSGKFILRPSPQQRRSHYFLAAGSGITPIYTMMLAVLRHEPDSFVYLLYGNQNGKSTIFADEIAELEKQFADRLIVRHCHSSPGWFSESPWYKGRINAQAVQKFIQENPPYAQDVQYYLCGPGSFLHDLKAALNGLDVPNNRIQLESFGGVVQGAKSMKSRAALSINLYGEHHELEVADGQTLLRAMLSQGLSPPYSCEGGICGTCRCSLIGGEISMINNLILDQEQIDSGVILACQSLAKSPKLKIEYSQ